MAAGPVQQQQLHALRPWGLGALLSLHNAETPLAWNEDLFQTGKLHCVFC